MEENRKAFTQHRTLPPGKDGYTGSLRFYNSCSRNLTKTRMNAKQKPRGSGRPLLGGSEKGGVGGGRSPSSLVSRSFFGREMTSTNSRQTKRT